MKRKRLIAAVRDRMRSQATARAADEASAGRLAESYAPAAAGPAARPVRPEAPVGLSEAVRDERLEQLEAEARYHRDRYELYHARVISGSPVPTSAARLRELARTATAAAERLAHARRTRENDAG